MIENDILPVLMLLCSAHTLCKLAQTCRHLRNFVSVSGEQTATSRLERFEKNNPFFREILMEFGGLNLTVTATLLSSVFDIDMKILVDAHKSVVEDILRKTSIILHDSVREIITVEMTTQGMKLLSTFWERKVFPLDSKMKSLFYFEEVEALFYNVVVVMQSMLLVLNYHLHSKEVVTWLKQKVQFIVFVLICLAEKTFDTFSVYRISVRAS
jgi:hypothetical protein